MARTAKISGADAKGAGTSATETTSARRKAAKSGPATKKPSLADPDPDTSLPRPLKKFCGGGYLAFLVVLILGGGASYMTYPKWYPKIADKLPVLKTFDPRVVGLDERIAELEMQTSALRAKDETILLLENERENLSRELGKALTRLESVEKSMVAVRELAKAAVNIDEAAEAKQSLQNLRGRLAALEQTHGSGVAASAKQLARLQEAQSRNRDLATRLATLEENQATADLASKTLADVKQRLVTVEKRVPTQTATRQQASGAQAAMVLAVVQLRDVAGRGAAYQREIDAVKVLSGGDTGLTTALSQLDDHAKTGVATLAILRDEFRDLASTIVAKAHNPAAEGWLDKVMAEIRALATVRRTNGGASETVENLVARAETRLTSGDLAAAVKAVKAIKPLSPEAASVSAAWLDRAVSRLSMERALAVLYIHAVSSLGGAAKE